jgi:hypothetical protein
MMKLTKFLFVSTFLAAACGGDDVAGTASGGATETGWRDHHVDGWLDVDDPDEHPGRRNGEHRIGNDDVWPHQHGRDRFDGDGRLDGPGIDR